MPLACPRGYRYLSRIRMPVPWFLVAWCCVKRAHIVFPHRCHAGTQGIRSLRINAASVLQTVIVEYGVPGVELLAMRSPVQSPGEGTIGATPLDTALQQLFAQPATTLPQPLPHPFPAGAKPPESVTPQVASLSQFQAACAALVSVNPHAESGSASPLALCAANACEPPAKVASQADHAPSTCYQQSGFQTGIQAGTYAQASGANRADVRHLGTAYIAQESGAAAACAGGTDPLRAMAVPMQTPQRSAQHARAHVATPVDLQKLLQGGADARRLPLDPDVHATADRSCVGARGVEGTHGAGAAGAQHVAMPSVAKSEDVGVLDLGSALSALPVCRPLEQHEYSAVDLRAADVFQAGWIEHSASEHAQHWQAGGLGVGALGAQVAAQLMDKQARLAARNNGTQTVAPPRSEESAEAGRLVPFRLDSDMPRRPPGSGDVRPVVGAVGQLGVGACIPAPLGTCTVARTQPSGAQQVLMSAAAAPAGMDPSCPASVAPTALRQDVGAQEAGAGQQHSTAVQSLWLWAGVYGLM